MQTVDDVHSECRVALEHAGHTDIEFWPEGGFWMVASRKGGRRNAVRLPELTPRTVGTVIALMTEFMRTR